MFEACRQRPAVLVVDEAHTLAPQGAEMLLNAGQELSDTVPFGLVLAGRSQIWRTLDDAQVSFAMRGRRIPLERLVASESATAIVEPMAQDGIEVAPDALDEIIEDAQGYPFFLQCWGDEIWMQVQESSARVVDAEAVESAAPDIASMRRDLYAECFEKLRTWQCVAVADAVASAFGDREELTAEELDVHVLHALDGLVPVRGMEAPNLPEALWALEEADLVWRPAADRWRRGIPSLIAYVLARIAQPAPSVD